MRTLKPNHGARLADAAAAALACALRYQEWKASRLNSSLCNRSFCFVPLLLPTLTCRTIVTDLHRRSEICAHRFPNSIRSGQQSSSPFQGRHHILSIISAVGHGVHSSAHNPASTSPCQRYRVISIFSRIWRRWSLPPPRF